MITESISRNKLYYIVSHFQVAGNNTLKATDKFAKVRPLLEHLNKQLKKNAMRQEMHSIDEAMVQYFGHHGSKQFIHGKPIQQGYK